MGSGSNTKNVFIQAGVFLGIILLGLCLYLPALQSKAFYFDDIASIQHDDAIKTIDISQIFNAFNTRFLPGLSFALNYHFWALNPVAYRLTNFLIHCLNAVLVYLLVNFTLGVGTKPLTPGRLKWGAFFAAALFLYHPIQTEAVDSVTQRFVLLASFFYLLTLVFYIQYRCRDQKRYLIGAVSSGIAAMFCKEFVITLPIMLALYEFYFLGSLKAPVWNRAWNLAPFFVIVLIVPFLLLRAPTGTIPVATIASANVVREGKMLKFGSQIDITRARCNYSRKQYFLTELNVVRTYVRLLFCPINLNLDYDYPISNEIDLKTLISAVFLLCLLLVAVLTYKSYRLVSFGILWFFIALSVESSVIPIGDVINEYRVYLASVGFAFLVMYVLYRSKADQKQLNIIAAIILIALSVLTYQRNVVWKTEFSIWKDTVQKSPHKARPINNLGNVYLEQGDFTEALSDFTEAIEDDPTYAMAYINRGYLFAQQGKFTQAILDFSKNIQIYPQNFEAYNDRGNAYAKLGNYTQAIADYTKAIELEPTEDYEDLYINRGYLYAKEGEYPQAILDFNKGLEVSPQNAEGHDDRGSAYAKEGDFTQAVLDYTKAIELNPKDAEAYTYRGCIYAGQGNFADALSDFDQALSIDPKNLEAYFNRGQVFDKEGNLSQAVGDYSEAIELNPKNAEYYNNRGIIYAKLNKFSRAIADFNQALEIDPKNAEYYNNQGLTYDMQGNPDQALDDYNKAIGINPDYADAYFNRGIIDAKQDNFIQAISDYSKTIEIKPDYGKAYSNRAISYYYLKEYDKAWDSVRRAKDLGALVDPKFVAALSQAIALGAQ